MRTDIGSSITELENLIADWLTKKQILEADEVIEVNVRIKKITRVAVKIGGHHDFVEPSLISLKEVGFTERTLGCLYNENLLTAADVQTKTLEEVRKYRNLGKKGVREIFEKLSSIGVRLDWQLK